MRPLEPGQLKVMRIHALGWLLLIPAALVAEAVIARNLAGFPAGLVLVPLLLLLVYPVIIAPPRRFRAWGYDRVGEELHVARGIWTRIETIVPFARVQHIDVAQGAIERRFGVSRLLLHTAGTMHNVVVLPGLARETAEALRDEIRGRIRDDAL